VFFIIRRVYNNLYFLDLIAIPDFVSGAMENWGLITFRETNMIYNKDESSTVDKQKVNGVVAHEVAHMWFGNLGKHICKGYKI
jgi:glutamyl aminopeptidase